MAEVKNSFISSKMNKDLDDRLIPSNEYRDALNIEVGKSETNNIGVLQNVLGNFEIDKEDPEDNLTCIGMFMDNQNNKIYQFLTNYADPTPSEITLCTSLQYQPLNGWVMKITVFDNDDQSYSTLVEGTFLNFSTTNLVLGVNLLEGLLFWTDNRNQPRKINVNNALLSYKSGGTPYYTTEVQISVAKYSPVEPISLFRRITTTAASNQSSFSFTVANPAGIVPGMTIISQTNSPNISGSDFIVVEKVVGSTITVYNNNLAVAQPSIDNGATLTFMASTMTNKSDMPDWPGDPSFLEDKYFRFSYRFKFDDNEYSLMAPFTQITYIPKQKGYFINGNELDAYRSTVVNWMENYVNNIELLIPLPDICSNVRNSYKIIQLEILSKEADSTAVKVIDTIPYTAIATSPLNSTNIYNYPYQSQKPISPLTEGQTTRVYDLVPVRALAQETAGNRIIYGNFYSTYTAPSSIVYNTTVLPKSTYNTNFIEYPNHTLKQNRNYQVGFILADKFGRQSSVILSAVDLYNFDDGNGVAFGGSTVYAPYQEENDISYPDVKDWFGNALVTLVSQPIASTRSIPNGTPGLYAEPVSTNGFSILPGAAIAGNTYTFTLETTPTPPATSVTNILPVLNDKMRGAFTDYVTVLSVSPTPGVPPTGTFTITTNGRINDLYLSANPPLPAGTLDTKFAYKINEIGWYSYKVVVKQQQQEYYNTYLPGMLAGYPTGQTSGSQTVYVPPGPSFSVNKQCNWVSGSNVITTFGAATTGDLKINDDVGGINITVAKITEIVSSTQFKIDQPAGVTSTAPSQTVNFYRAASIGYNVEQYGINSSVFPVGEESKTSHIVLINDNINKIPRDLTEVGPDQKQYRSSVEIYGKVENASATIDNVIANIPTVTNYYATEITYDVATVEAAHPGFSILVKVGDGIQSVEANTPILQPAPNAPIANPYRWLANTVITAHTVDPTGTTGTIAFSPPNIIISPDYKTFKITYAENQQYYPTRKADLVSSIATSSEFNFLPNDVSNLKGSAGLNLYQLQSSPLVGRISTVKKIGVEGPQMVPFLSVYETAPFVSELALFWETATTGYISDLNYDVLTGFNGPSQITDPGFLWYENQDPNGTGLVEGAANSRFITDKFEILNSSGVPLSPTNVVLDSAFNAATPSIDLKSNFEVYQFSSTEYRLRLQTTSPGFIFTRLANTDSKVIFNLKITTGSGASAAVYYFPINGTLKNITPSFVLPGSGTFNTLIDQDPQSIVTITAKNGTFIATAPQNQTDLFWEIIGGNSANYFNINKFTGLLSLNPTSVYIAPQTNLPIPIGLYDLTIRVWDAYSFAPDGPLVPANTPEGSLYADITVRITIGPKPVPDGLQYYTNDAVCWGPDQGTGAPGTPYNVPGQGYGAIYIGNESLGSLVPPDLTTITPTVPASLYQNIYKIGPKLTQGALECRVGSNLQGDTGETRTTETFFVVFWRPSVGFAWQPVLDSNGGAYPESETLTWSSGVGVPPTGKGIFLRIINILQSGYRNTYFTLDTIGEYCIVLKNTYSSSIAPSPGFPVNGSASIVVRDANWNYLGAGETSPTGTVTFAPPFGIPVPRYYQTGVSPGIGYKYLVGLTKPDIFSTSSGIPWTVQNPANTFLFPTIANPEGGTATVSVVPVSPALLNTNVYNEQLTPGLKVTYRTVNTGPTCNGGGLTITGDTTYLKKGMYVGVISGAGAFASNTYITDVLSVGFAGSFMINQLPTTGLSAATVQGTNNYFPAGTKIAGSVQGTGSTGIITLDQPMSLSTPIPIVGSIVDFQWQNPAVGYVYAASDNGLFVNQFYTDNILTQPWTPPIASRFYTFQNNDRDYNISSTTGTTPVTNKPWFSAKFNNTGGVIKATGVGENTVKTGWTYSPNPSNTNNLNWQRNVEQKFEI